LGALVSTTVVENTRAKVALVADDDRVSAEVFTPVDGGNVLTELETGETVISIETGFARSQAFLAFLRGFIKVIA
jgi:hypothetical protein